MRTQRIVTEITCDRCGEPAHTTFVANVDAGDRVRSSPRRVDLCADHAQPFTDMAVLLRTMRAYTHRPDREEKNVGGAEASGAVCPLCARQLTRNGLLLHVRKVHGVPDIEMPTTCPDCGRAAENRQAALIHRYRAHGYDLIAAMVAAHTSPPAARVVGKGSAGPPKGSAGRARPAPARRRGRGAPPS